MADDNYEEELENGISELEIQLEECEAKLAAAEARAEALERLCRECRKREWLHSPMSGIQSREEWDCVTEAAIAAAGGGGAK